MLGESKPHGADPCVTPHVLDERSRALINHNEGRLEPIHHYRRGRFLTSLVSIAEHLVVELAQRGDGREKHGSGIR